MKSDGKSRLIRLFTTEIRTNEKVVGAMVGETWYVVLDKKIECSSWPTTECLAIDMQTFGSSTVYKFTATKPGKYTHSIYADADTKNLAEQEQKDRDKRMQPMGFSAMTDPKNVRWLHDNPRDFFPVMELDFSVISVNEWTLHHLQKLSKDFRILFEHTITQEQATAAAWVENHIRQCLEQHQKSNFKVFGPLTWAQVQLDAVE